MAKVQEDNDGLVRAFSVSDRLAQVWRSLEVVAMLRSSDSAPDGADVATDPSRKVQRGRSESRGRNNVSIRGAGNGRGRGRGGGRGGRTWQ